jgi:hypothetical protein
MEASLKKTGLTLVVVGLAFSSLAPITGGLVESSAVRSGGSLAASFGAILFTFGCIQIAKAKGQAWYVGLLGLLSCLGLAILWFVVPDKNATR